MALSVGTAYGDVAIEPAQLARLFELLSAAKLEVEDLQSMEVSVASIDIRNVPSVVQDGIRLLRLISKLKTAPLEPTLPRVKRITPFIPIPWTTIHLATPLGDYIGGSVADAFSLTTRDCAYLLYRSRDDGHVHVAEGIEPWLFDQIAKNAHLEKLFATSNDLERTVSDLLSLAKRGIIIWLRPGTPHVR